MTKDEALKMRKEQDEYWSKIIKQIEQQETWRHDCIVMGYGWTTWENGCRHCGQSAPSWFNKEKHMTTYEQPLAWMQKLESEVDGKKVVRYTFTKDRIGVNDIPVYIQNDNQPAQEPVPLVRNKNGNYSPKHQWQGLTDDEIDEIADIIPTNYEHDFARAIEAKLKEKNHA